jgi:hypothetical protein
VKYIFINYGTLVFLMKIVLTILIAILAISLLGISSNNNNIGNAFAQMNQGTDGMMGNDTSSKMMGMGDGDSMMKLNGTINVESAIAETLKSKVTTDILGAIQAAKANVGTNSIVKEAELTEAYGYLVYIITAVDENMKEHIVIVDPGNGQVLLNKEVILFDEYDKMKYGDRE